MTKLALERIQDRERKVDAAKEVVRGFCSLRPRVALILGSGLGSLANDIQDPVDIAYHSIPGFARATAGGHQGRLILGTLSGVNVVAMAGRFHRYEGWSTDQVTFPVFLMNRLGAETLVVSNAAGAVNTRLRVGDIVAIRDHIQLMLGVARLDANQDATLPMRSSRADGIYSHRLTKLALQAAVEHRFLAVEGTYLATLGPNYETRAEYRMMRKLGADVVGMSTVPEVLAASSLGMDVAGLSMVSNVANPDRPIEANHEEVLAAGKEAAVKMKLIVDAMMRDIRLTDQS